jgi:hypothetical protein
MVRRTLLVMAALSALCCSGAEPFQLQLSALSETWFPGGAVIKVPPDKCPELVVKLSKPWSRETQVDAIALKLDDTYPKFKRLISGDEYLLDVTTREPLGLLTKDTHYIEAVVTGKSPLRASWTVMRWDKAYAEAVATASGGLPIGIQLDSPVGGLVLIGQGNMVRFRGKLSGADDAKLTIAGEKVSRLVSKPGFQFDMPIKISPAAKEVVVRGDDSAGDATILVLRVQN